MNLSDGQYRICATELVYNFLTRQDVVPINLEVMLPYIRQELATRNIEGVKAFVHAMSDIVYKFKVPKKIEQQIVQQQSNVKPQVTTVFD